MTTIDEMKERKDVDGLINILFTQSVSYQIYAGRALGEIGEPAVERLTEYLHDESPNVRWRAAMALSEAGETAVPALIGILNNESSTARIPASWAVAEIGDTRAVEPLYRMFKTDESECCRAIAAAGLLKIGDADSISKVRDDCAKMGDDFIGQVLEAFYGS